MAQYQVGKRMVQESGSAQYQIGAIYVIESFSALYEESVSQSLQFTQNIIAAFPVDASSALQFSDVIVLINKLQPIIEQTVSFSSDAPVPGQTKEHEASSSVSFSQASTAFNSTQYATSGVSFSQEAGTTNPQPYEQSESQTISFGSTARSDVVDVVASGTVNFTHLATSIKIVPGTDLSENQTVDFSDTATSVFVSVNALPEDATDTVEFSQTATLPQFKVAYSTVVFSATATKERIKNIEETVEFGENISTAGSIWDRQASSAFTLSQSFVYQLGVPDLCYYAPSVGSGTFPSKPTITRQSSVTLFYPTVTPTTTVIIRAPEIGDRDRLQNNIINRETRGGTLKIFADDDWPKLQIIEMQFTALTEAEAQSVLTFFETTLGLEIGFTDWEGRTWHGVIVSPEREVVRSRRGIVDLSFEFEGEIQ